MAQTVATVRGSGSSASNGGNATLFTQSGGNATRVILNQFNFSTPDGGAVYTASIKLNHSPTNGGNNAVGWWVASSSGNYMSSGQLCPNPNGTGPTECTTFNPGYVMFPVNAAFVNGGISYYTNSYNTYSYAPQNFWIGPGDSVTFSWSWASGTNGINYYYHFTTITES
jgi:hypothetical protein